MNLTYLKLDARHPEYEAALAACVAAFEAASPGSRFVANKSADGSAAWIKTSIDHGLEGSPVVIDTAPLVDAVRVATECASPEWTPVRTRGDRPS